MTNTSCGELSFRHKLPFDRSSLTCYRQRLGEGQFVPRAKALRGLDASSTQRQAFDGYALGPVIADLENLTGVEAKRIHVDKGYRGHNHARGFWAWTQARCRASPP